MNRWKHMVMVVALATLGLARLEAEAVRSAGTMRVGETTDWPCYEVRDSAEGAPFHFKVASPLEIKTVEEGEAAPIGATVFSGASEEVSYCILLRDQLLDEVPENYEKFERVVREAVAEERPYVVSQGAPRHAAIRYRADFGIRDGESGGETDRAACMLVDKRIYILIVHGVDAKEAAMFFDSFTPLK